ncbi:hypothetical protein KKB64_00410 [Patescibacteria group bacterium]|nr:hypothetical protein [Patescibacteria group bacterium]MBU1472236.1 hypothetical protein [Patescibacteria group bacterium]MBU2460513.1 hypothetical protein [Patescibacteria group bacterium]MBU2544752.1 hypothetical protein [Patescibacteria group bacterium]
MLTLILPGYSPANRQWALKVKENLKLPGEVIVHEWQHWRDGKSFNLKYEVDQILAIIGKQQVNFIAKSVGTRVLMALLPKINKQVQKVILCGIPIDPLRYVKGIKLIGRDHLLVVQNSQDPLMPYKLIETYIHLIDKKIKAVEKEAKNHDYPYFDDFQRFLTI